MQRIYFGQITAFAFPKVSLSTILCPRATPSVTTVTYLLIPRVYQDITHESSQGSLITALNTCSVANESQNKN